MAKLEGGKVSPLPDEIARSPMGDSAIFRMLERYVNFSIELRMALAKDLGRKSGVVLAKNPEEEPSVREEVEARPGSVPSCPQVVDEILLSQQEAEAAKLRDAALNTFKDQTKRPLDWYVSEAKKQSLKDHPKGLKSERVGKGSK